MTAFFNTGLTQQQFLEQYWQKKPLLIRQAFTNFEPPISPDDLAGLACENDIESRLIEEKGDSGPWQVSSGPFIEADFENLPATHWTMLVQDVDKHLPELQGLLDPFRFIPDWRRDDLMVSYAPEHGTVGPHTDGYDVFLLQAMGTRRWQISDEVIKDADLIQGLDIQILQDFTADHTWDLLPGDMLYLPPHYAHHGVALNDCMTFSIGFRAPSKVDVLDTVINNMLEQGLSKERYSDPDLKVSQHPHEITQQVIKEVKQLLHEAIDEAEPLIATSLGRLLTESKSSLVELAEQYGSDSLTTEEVSGLFTQGHVLERNLYYRIAWTSNEDGRAVLFAAGEAYEVSNIEHALILSEQTEITQKDWAKLSGNVETADLLCHLIAEGVWIWQADDE